MNLHSLDDTIVAISTPPGQSGIGIVRLTGPNALSIADKIFAPLNNAQIPSVMHSFHNAYGHVVDNALVIDEVILTVMRAPRTYTTQDVVEINCHGGPVPLRRTLELALKNGARLAEPGEFTQRAFLFGRIDLAQAEAVNDIISARTEQAAQVAEEQLSGRLSREVLRLRDILLEIIAYLEAAIDFGDDDLGLPALTVQLDRMQGLHNEFQALIQSSQFGRALRDGIVAAIIGRPNVGKSSLMNALLGHERVIVTEIPGTTRDVVEHILNIAGVPVTLADTAGMRETTDIIEAMGVERSRQAAAKADINLLVLDGVTALQEEDFQLLSRVTDTQTIVVVNKSDLPKVWCVDELVEYGEFITVPISAKHSEGLEKLEEAISEKIWGGGVASSESLLVTNVRHCAAIERADLAIIAAIKTVNEGRTEEYVVEELRPALDALGEIVGLTLTQDIINLIFEKFCIGK